MEQKTNEKASEKLQWHPAFAAALRIELEEELSRLDIREEFQLTKKPLQMDVLIVRKEDDVPVKKNIGRIFRKHNIIEYKSPDDSLSINDFYKVYGYACVYQSDTDRVMEIHPQDLTLTFVCSRFPRKFLRHLEEVREIKARRIEEGIYYLEGDSVPMQLLIPPRLSPENNYWMQHLRGNLKRGNEIEELMKRYEEHSHSRWYQAAMDLIIRANWENVKEEKNMCEALRELFADELRESEEKGLAAGAEKKLISQVCAKLKRKICVEEIAGALEEKIEVIHTICEVAADYAPDYDVEKIYDKLKEGENRK